MQSGDKFSEQNYVTTKTNEQYTNSSTVIQILVIRIHQLAFSDMNLQHIMYL